MKLTIQPTQPTTASVFLLRITIAVLVLAVFCIVSVPGRADDAADAQKAFDAWKAALENVARKKAAVKVAEEERSTALSNFKDEKNLTDAEKETLQVLDNKLAQAKADLKVAEDELMAAFNGLTDALAKLPEDNALRKELIRQRGILMTGGQTRYSPQAQQNVQTKTGGGLIATTFNTPPGRVILNLPDDMRAGDTISGTVICQPNGNTKAEREANKAELDKLELKLVYRGMEERAEKVVCGEVAQPLKVILLGDERADSLVVGLFRAMGQALAQMKVPVHPSGAIITPDPKITQPTHPSGAIITPDPKITQPTHPSGAIITPDPKVTQPTHPSGAIITPDPKVTQPTHPSGAIITPDPKITQPTHPSGAIITPDPKVTQPTHPSGAIITPDPKITQPTHPSGAIITPDPKITPTPDPTGFRPSFFDVPLLGQQGRTVEITGPFDGDSSNTQFNWGPPQGVATGVSVQTEEDRNNMGRTDLPLAESPRKAVFNVPSTFVGSTEVTVREGTTETRSPSRIVGVKLSAPKTSLLKGEQTRLSIEVVGLDGIKEPVPLTIESGGVIKMEGGMYQPLMIQPSQVSADGRYTTTRGVTGITPGAWNSTATVVTRRFNACMQNDSSPATVVLWNTVTGDYTFSPPAGSAGTSAGGGVLPPRSQDAGPTGTAGILSVGYSSSFSGHGKIAMKGCIITLSHNAPDRRVFAKLDACTNQGNATIEVPATKQKFTVTDRNTADNSCR